MATQHSNQGSLLPINVGILGAGNMGQRLAKAFQAVPQVSVRYVYSRKLAQAEMLAKLHGAKAVTETGPIFDDRDVDAVVICLPTYTRMESLRPAVASQKHIFCEKPLALHQVMADDRRRKRGHDRSGVCSF